ncbi:MAG: hypothetical protein JSS29_19495 [Proteobacteria bacterium]|nr:hypothetical protein [Pseudomonadota bacterium]
MAEDEDSDELPIRLPRVPQLANEMRKALTGMPDRMRAEISFEFKKWQATQRDGREVLGVLNERYDLWVFECASPAPWIAAGFDTKEGALILGALLPRDVAVDAWNCAAHLARALGEEVTSLKIY